MQQVSRRGALREDMRQVTVSPLRRDAMTHAALQISEIGSEIEWFKVSQLAEHLQCNEALIYQQIRSGALPAYRIGVKAYRVRRDDWFDYLERRLHAPEVKA